METIKIVNFKQACMYVKNGVKPIDICYTDKLVFIFNKDETTEVFKKWREYSLA